MAGSAFFIDRGQRAYNRNPLLYYGKLTGTGGCDTIERYFDKNSSFL